MVFQSAQRCSKFDVFQWVSTAEVAVRPLLGRPQPPEPAVCHCSLVQLGGSLSVWWSQDSPGFLQSVQLRARRCHKISAELFQDCGVPPSKTRTGHDWTMGPSYGFIWNIDEHIGTYPSSTVLKGHSDTLLTRNVETLGYDFNMFQHRQTNVQDKPVRRAIVAVQPKTLSACSAWRRNNQLRIIGFPMCSSCLKVICTSMIRATRFLDEQKLQVFYVLMFFFAFLEQRSKSVFDNDGGTQMKEPFWSGSTSQQFLRLQVHISENLKHVIVSPNRQAKQRDTVPMTNWYQQPEKDMLFWLSDT